MDAPSTGVSSPASNNMMIGVTMGEITVDTEVIATDSATSPLAKYATTLDVVPPGTDPSISKPIASMGLSPSSLATATAPSGMMTNCVTTPTKIGKGRRITCLKSGSVNVSPMHSMMMAISVETYGVNGVNGSGMKNARAEPARIKAGNANTAMRAERSSALICFVMCPSYGAWCPLCEIVPNFGGTSRVDKTRIVAG